MTNNRDTQSGGNQLIPDSEPIHSCRWCGYDGNSPKHMACEVCGRSLGLAIQATPVEEPSSSSPPPARRFPWAILAGLFFLSSLLLLWRPWETQKPTPNPTFPSTRRLNASSDIRLYESMKDVPNVPRGLFSHGGGLPFAAIDAKGMNDVIANAHPEFRLRYTEPLHGNPGSDTGISMLIDGELSFARSVRPLEASEYKRAKEQGSNLEQVPVLIDGLIFFVHPGLSLPGLSVDQLQSIFRGKVTNWKALGGPDLEILPISLDLSATSSLKQLLGSNGDDIGKNVKIVRDYTTAIRQVAITPGAISYASSSVVVGQKTIRVLGLARNDSNQYISGMKEEGEMNTAALQDGTYPFTRRLFVIIRRDGTPDEQAGVAYANLLLSREAQLIIQKAGFVSLY